MIPIDKIHIQNPRKRNKGRFQGMVENISHVGLKRPITVSPITGAGQTKEYNLVCGQGRLEACLELGEHEIAAIVIDVSQEEQLLMSLVENVARRHFSTTELMREVRAQKARGCKAEQIAQKLDHDVAYINGILHLLEHGEERLVREVEAGRVALTVAMEISSSDDAEIQRVLCEAYADNSLRGKKLSMVRRLIQQRMAHGKTITIGKVNRQKARPSKEMLLRAYREETHRQQLIVKKAQLTENRLLVILSAVKTLLRDENFITMLRAESLDSMPKYLADKIQYRGNGNGGSE